MWRNLKIEKHHTYLSLKDVYCWPHWRPTLYSTKLEHEILHSLWRSQDLKDEFILENTFFHHYSTGSLTVSNLNQRIQGKVLTWQLLSVWDSLNIKNVYIIPSLRSNCDKVETQQILLILWIHCQGLSLE